ncbi:uncharacterized protein MELLADRAFT_71405 [Melampsora larici-populina 98AG31]|uniref:Uncharacterized protein n=1 Tax=Melampsora larici-populina (strain 98AG31 / pathotype 3-4-7) TaxID=747676 RepID=F4RFZ2_MELLP|nr:uncharacterized protein MELLADRAFT_71405 [Melampsora larici-populina 98AG31]EGG08458.1 hypothetical protein MELLADRAFT_71405 [Melampsora larici-populina 98AG31]
MKPFSARLSLWQPYFTHCFAFKFFHKWFDGKSGVVSMKAKSTLRRIFSQYALDSPRPSSSNKDNTHASSSNPSHLQPKMFHDDSDDEDVPSDTIDNSLDNYLLMSDKMRAKNYNLVDPKAALEWWSGSYCSIKCLASS